MKIISLFVLIPLFAACQSNNTTSEKKQSEKLAKEVQQRMKTGEYDMGLVVGFDIKEKRISGIIDMKQDGRFSCKIIFNGYLKNSSDSAVAVDFYDPMSHEKIESGTIQWFLDHVKIKSNATITSCQNLIDLNSGERFDLMQERPILTCAYIKAEKSYISKEPDNVGRTNMYLVKGDVIAILSEQDGFANFEYKGKRKVTGWIRKDDLQVTK